MECARKTLVVCTIIVLTMPRKYINRINKRAAVVAKTWRKKSDFEKAEKIVRFLNGKWEKGIWEVETAAECHSELKLLVDSWLEAAYKLESWPMRLDFEENLTRRSVNLYVEQTGGEKRPCVSFRIAPLRFEEDLGLGGFKFVTMPGRIDAIEMFFDLITGAYFDAVGVCKRCGNYYLNSWGHTNKQFCSSRCSRSTSAEIATRKRREVEMAEKLNKVKAAMKEFDKLSPERRLKVGPNWKRWMARKAGVDITPNFITRHIALGNLKNLD